jgi:chromosome segregation ATPase
MKQKKVKILTPIKERILQFVDYEKINKTFFFEKIGIASTNFRGEGAKSDLGTDKIVKILTEFPEINSEWLLTGKGKMLRSEEPTAQQPDVVKPPPEDSANLISIIKEQAEQIGSLKKENEHKNEIIKELKAEIEQLKNKIRRLQSGADERGHTTDQMQEFPHIPVHLVNPHLIAHEQDNPQ